MTALFAVAFDWILGDPPNALHPVSWFGNLIHALERRAPKGHPRAELLSGGAITLVGVMLAALSAHIVEKVFRHQGLFGALVLGGAFKLTLAWRGLIKAGGQVQMDLELGKIVSARQSLRALVSRDTTHLDEPLIAAATIESLAENASDSFVAPLFYYHLLGLSGACAYRAVNTLDAMLGYRGPYEFLGKFAARLDDVLNFIPSRLTALLIILAARSRRAWQVWRHDHARPPSPNAGQPMSAMAGALQVRLEKVGQYVLCEFGRLPASGDIARAARLVNLTLAFAAGLSLAFEWSRRRGR